MKLTGQTRKTRVTLKFLSEQSTEEILTRLDANNVDFDTLDSAVVTEVCTTRLQRVFDADTCDYTKESLVSQLHYGKGQNRVW